MVLRGPKHVEGFMEFLTFYCVWICFRFLSLKTKDTSASSWLFDFVSYCLARYKNENYSFVYVDNSKINLRLAGKEKRVVVVPNRALSSNKYRLLSLNANRHTFSLRSVGVITDETWTLTSPLPPDVIYVLWDRKGILLTEFMTPGTTITSEVYCETLHDNVRPPTLRLGSHKCF